MAKRAPDLAQDTTAPQSAAAPLPPGNREEQLLVIACRLFAQRGFQATSLRDIAEEAKISKAALYHYFPNKDELYERVVIEAMDALVQSVGADVARADTPTARVHAFMGSTAKFLDNHRDQWLAGAHAFREAGQIERRGVALHLRDTYEKLLHRCIEDGISSGEFRNMNAAMAARLLLSALNYVPRWHSPNGKLSVSEVMAQFVDIVLLGITTRDPAQALDPALLLAAMPEPGKPSHTTASARTRTRKPAKATS